VSIVVGMPLVTLDFVPKAYGIALPVASASVRGSTDPSVILSYTTHCQ
jgi:hypothetical protein